MTDDPLLCPPAGLPDDPLLCGRRPSVGLPDDSRYSRQQRLPEVGDAGQRRLERASLEARGRDGALIELAYLYRAGVNRVALTPLEPAEPFVHAQAFRFEAPRGVGAGAWRALAQIRRVLEMEKR